MLRVSSRPALLKAVKDCGVCYIKRKLLRRKILPRLEWLERRKVPFWWLLLWDGLFVWRVRWLRGRGGCLWGEQGAFCTGGPFVRAVNARRAFGAGELAARRGCPGAGVAGAVLCAFLATLSGAPQRQGACSSTSVTFNISERELFIFWTAVAKKTALTKKGVRKTRTKNAYTTA